MFDFFSEKYPFTLKFGAKVLIASRKCKGPSGETCIFWVYRLPALRACSVSQPDNEPSRIAG